MNDSVFCPNCGEEMMNWQSDILECPECGTMVDAEIFKEEEKW
ncbi:hypothetical protein [Enterococcus wangshanyuanii]|uniref:Uncharacterized protein n=1 Tax=Enterococcus wangshanyuanii TaxID=2005703 RepID=A0ABQ1NZU7_9ENTE|nr:hypothetical protein [Enterococcus wangshanyuanii]GGC88173.1 hypothetical protein GCM10011573_17220 [Enterococcus wangshanyuanii]